METEESNITSLTPKVQEVAATPKDEESGFPPISIENTKELIWSVSLIPHIPHLGYMVGEEIRKKEKGMSFHLVGGKTESWDIDPVATAVREFIEETNLLAIPFFQDYAHQQYLQWISQNEITLNTKYPHFTSFLQPLFEESVRTHSKYFDEKVSNPKWMGDHYLVKIHRFYIWDASKSSISREIGEFPFIFNHFHPYLRIHDKMWSLYWLHLSHFSYLQNKSQLFMKFAKYLEDQKKKRI